MENKINIDEKTDLGGIDIYLKQDKWIKNTNKYSTVYIVFYGEIFQSTEIIMLQRLLQSFCSNRMIENKRYKITDRVYAQIVKKHDYMLALRNRNGEEITVMDKVYALYWSAIIQAILQKFPIFIHKP